VWACCLFEGKGHGVNKIGGGEKKGVPTNSGLCCSNDLGEGKGMTASAGDLVLKKTTRGILDIRGPNTLGQGGLPRVWVTWESTFQYKRIRGGLSCATFRGTSGVRKGMLRGGEGGNSDKSCTGDKGNRLDQKQTREKEEKGLLG